MVYENTKYMNKSHYPGQRYTVRQTWIQRPPPTHSPIHIYAYIGAWWSYLTLPVPQLLGHPCKTCHCNSLGTPPGSAVSAALCCGVSHLPVLCGPWKGKSNTRDLKLRFS